MKKLAPIVDSRLYVDNRPLLVAGKPEIRRYKAVFFLGKAELGLESDVAEATARP